MLFETIFSRRVKKFREFPGPAPSFPLGNLGRFGGGRQPWEVCAELCKQYGSVARVWFLNKPALILNDPDLIGEVLDGRRTEFYKKAPCQALAPVITRQSLFISNPPQWKPARDENPLSFVPFDEWFPDQLPLIRDSIRRSLKNWIAQSNSIDLFTETQRLSFQAFAQAFWGREFPIPCFEWFQTLARTGDKRMKTPVPLPPPLHPSFYSARRSWYDGFEALVAAARRDPDESRSDLLAVCLRKGSSLSDPSMAEALATNFFGGVFSCSSTVNTALYLLAQHPLERTKLVDSLQADLGTDENYDLSALDGCQPLESVLREAMRYYPAVPIYFRNASKDRSVALGEHEIPADTLLLISNWYLHKFSDHWGDPERFRPDRWDDGVMDANPVGSGYFFPFGRGARMCIGTDFALRTMKLALATILLEANVDLDPQQPYQQAFFFGVMMPKLRARFTTFA